MEGIRMGVDNYSRYDVYLVKLPTNAIGSEQKGTRPVVVWNISDYDPALDKYITTLNCFCLTTEEKNKLPVHFLIKANRSCLKEDSTFLAEQAVMLHESDLLEKWGTITDKEYRYMMYKTIDISLERTQKHNIFNYSYKFLIESKEISEGLVAMEFLIKKEDLNEELKKELKSYIEPTKNKIIDICRKHNVISGNYIKELSEGNIDFSYLNL
jgi:mRNA-degrading endonuclease toxin of MazEF toxin-antitoxin module